MSDQAAIRNLIVQNALKDLVIDYWRDVDAHDAARALDYYTEDCVYLMCGHRMEGRAAIGAYYEYRRQRGAPRLVRHLVANKRARPAGPDRGVVEGSSRPCRRWKAGIALGASDPGGGHLGGLCPRRR